MSDNVICKVPLRGDQVEIVKARLTDDQYQPMAMFRLELLTSAIDVVGGCDIHLRDGQVIQSSYTASQLFDQIVKFGAAAARARSGTLDPDWVESEKGRPWAKGGLPDKRWLEQTKDAIR